jgi:hypothetical protein
MKAVISVMGAALITSIWLLVRRSQPIIHEI